MDLNQNNRLATFFPFIHRLKNYSFATLSKDFAAGLTVSVVLIPQVMAYAILAGLPPVHGLYAAFLGTAVAALWGSNSQLSTGPVALVSFLVLTALVPLAKPESPEYVFLAVALALLIGIIQLAMGVFKLGFIMNFISHSVIAGFTTAAAVIIATTQVPGLFGFSVTKHEIVILDIYEILYAIPETHFLTLSIGLISVASIILAKRYISKAFPAALIVMSLGVTIAYFLDFEQQGVKLIGDINASLSLPSLPSVQAGHLIALFPSALIISIVGFLEAYAISKSISAKTKEKTDVNQELIGQGLGNLVSSFFRGYPIAGSFSRTAVNFTAGAATEISSVFVSLIVLITILFFTPMLYYLPRAILSAIVIAALVDLIEFSKFRETFRLSGTDGIVITITFIFAFISQPDYAIFIGILVSLILFLRKTIAAKVYALVFYFEEERFRRLNDTNKIKDFPNLLLLRIDMSVFFANAHNIVEQIETLVNEKGPALESVCINFSGVNYVDVSACEVLGELFDELDAKNIRIFTMYRKEQVREIMKKSGLEDKLTMLKDIKGFKKQFIIQKNINIQ
ncbi:MAG: SulP family inorganic anion transporter [Acidobacteriota bacterium]|nr:SulP family inorganic anion transporter [Acidobacteriota bacterium]MDH3528118.1 SulP family inorganic anion transporter [Acidobacteriota bacterium]